MAWRPADLRAGASAQDLGHAHDPACGCRAGQSLGNSGKRLLANCLGIQAENHRAASAVDSSKASQPRGVAAASAGNLVDRWCGMTRTGRVTLV